MNQLASAQNMNHQLRDLNDLLAKRLAAATETRHELKHAIRHRLHQMDAIQEQWRNEKESFMTTINSLGEELSNHIRQAPICTTMTFPTSFYLPEEDDKENSILLNVSTRVKY